MRFQKNVVLVTGGGRGIGRSICQAFARHGAHVAVNYRKDEKSARDTLASLSGSDHLLAQCDITDDQVLPEFIHKIENALGPIDVLVNNAAVHQYHPVDEVDYDTWRDEWERTLQTNLIAASNLAYCVSQSMMRRRRGSIVFVSSRGAFRGEAKQMAYGASKGAINSFGQSLAQAMAPYGVGVGIVAPGFVETDMVSELLSGPEGDDIRAQSPFGRVARPEEIANAVLYLADPAHIWSSGTIIDVNGASYLR